MSTIFASGANYAAGDGLGLCCFGLLHFQFGDCSKDGTLELAHGGVVGPELDRLLQLLERGAQNINETGHFVHLLTNDVTGIVMVA
jgi:hypothetical protein